MFYLYTKWYDSEVLSWCIEECSFEYLKAIIGTPLERSFVTIWCANGDMLRINLTAAVAWKLSSRSNPLEDPELYDNPLS